MGVYKSKQGKQHSQQLYDEQLQKLGYPFYDIFLTTSFGKTHLVETGNLSRKPLLVFHGGNSTTAYNLLRLRFLLDDFHIYAVDTVGHPGKSAEVILSSNNYDYGKWASEVITQLGFSKMNCFGASFGGGILAKLMCVAPEKIEKAVLLVPAGIGNAAPICSAKMMIPLIKYHLTKQEKYVKETALCMTAQEQALDEDILVTIKDSFDHVKIKAGMPSNVSGDRLRKCTAPTLVMAAERDCLFPASSVLPRAKKIIPNCKVHMLKGCGHIHMLPEREKKRIVCFLHGEQI